MPLDVTLPTDWAALRPQLEAACNTLGLPIDEIQRDALLAYGAMVQRWTRVYNLTALRSTREIFTHHLLDCAAAARPMANQLAAEQSAIGAVPSTQRVLDVGSGAGLPGAVLAILYPYWQVTCVDAVAKKTTFIRQAAAELRLPNLLATHGRVETAGLFPDAPFDLITSRAFASLADFIHLTRHLIRVPGGSWAAMKARLTTDERAELQPDTELFHVEQLHVPGLEDNARCLVAIRLRT